MKPAPRLSLIVTLLVAMLTSQAHAWQTLLNGSANDSDEVRAVALHPDGTVIAAGLLFNFHPLFPGDPLNASTDFTVTKFDSATGTELWRADVSDPDDRNADANDVVVHPDGDAVAAGVVRFKNDSGRFTVVKLSDADGSEVWRAQFDGTKGGDDIAYRVAIDAAGDVIAVGLIDHTATGADVFVAKLSGATGLLLWQQTLDSAGGTDTGFSLALNAAGDIAVATMFDQSFGVAMISGTNGSVLWTRQIFDAAGNGEARDIAFNNAGEIIAVGMIGDDFAVVKLNPAAPGNVMWTYRKNGLDNNLDVAFAVAVDANDDVFAAGTLVDGSGDEFSVVKLSASSGARIWGQAFGFNPPFGQAHDILLTPSGDVIAAGFTKLGATKDFAIIKYDGLNGIELERRTIEGTALGADQAARLLRDFAGNIVVGGFIEQTGQLPDYTVTKLSGFDFSDGLCGDGVASAAESCDEGAANGTANSCCNIDCTLRSAGSVCRDSAGVCDVAEVCTGADVACPIDSFEAATTECRGSGGVCDVAELCTGSGASCPADVLVAAATECRGTAGICDVAEACTGADVACPIDSFEAPTTECRGSGGVCDIAELCTGASGACPADGFLPSSTECRGAAGQCDIAEACTGTSGLCPADDLLSAVTECRGSAGACDVAEACTGADAVCPADAFVAVATECRASAGACDVAESCSGSGAQCPADAFETANTECRATAGACDVAESCSGSGAQCPADVLIAASTVCRAGIDDCDVAETCSGSHVACPSDAVAADGTACDDGAFCNGSDSCSGGFCLAHTGDPCLAGGECSNACDEIADNCFVAQGTACTVDANICTLDVCGGGGVCGHPAVPLPCDSISIQAGLGQSASVLGGAGNAGGVDLTFSSTDGGLLAVELFEIDPTDPVALQQQNLDQDPLGFLIPSSPLPVWNVIYDGGILGPVTLVFGYDETSFVVGLDEAAVAVMHRIDGQWQALSGIVDPVANTITVTVTQFSQFTLGTFADFDLDGVPDSFDNCPFVANGSAEDNQLDTDADGIGDVCECGDATGDGRVNTSDARIIQRCAVGQFPCPALCDVTGDGVCNTTDARLIQRMVVGDLTKQDFVCAERP